MKRKQFFTKSLFLLLFFALLWTASLSACKPKNRKYDEGEVLAAARELIDQSALLNEIYYGAGIPATDDLSGANGIYRPADEIYTAHCGIHTIDDLKDRTRQIYTRSMSEYIFQTKLNAISDEDGFQIPARYYQKYADPEQTAAECIMVNTRAENLLPDRVEYLWDTLAAVGSAGETVYVTLDALVTDGEGNTHRQHMRVSLLEDSIGQENAWRLDSPTYQRYNPDEDLYQDLKNRK